MKNFSSKKALFLSVISMVICVSMLIGSTFAWFTDSATANVNTIQAGNLDVELVKADGSPLTTALGWVKAEGHENEAVLWEPGCTYSLEGFKIRNAGNLALKYKVVISGLTGDATLLNAIEFTVKKGDTEVLLDNFEGKLLPKDSAATDGFEAYETSVITITGKMKQDAGNEYKGLSIDGIKITVYATQLAYESDSTGKDYDKDATYYPVLDAAGLKDALKAGGNVSVEANLAPAAAIVADKNATLNMNGKTIANITDIWDVEPNSWSLVSVREGATLTIDGNGTFKAKENDCYAVDVQDDGCKVVIKSGTFIGNIHAVYVYTGEAVIEGGFFSVQQKFSDAAKADEFVLNCYDANRANGTAKITVKGGTFVNFNPADCQAEGAHTNFVAEGYSVIKETQANGDVWYTVVEGTGASSNEELNNVISSATEPTTVTLGKGTYTLPTLENKDITVKGTKDTIVDMKNGVNKASSASFDGVTVNFGTENYKGFQHTGKLTYKDCTITGKQFLYAEEVEFINCEFVQDAVDYNVWTYGAGSVLFKDCTFTCKGKAVLIYNEGALSAQTVEFRNCKFESSSAVDGKAAIEIDSYGTSYNVIVDQATADNVTGFGTGSNSGNSVWNVKRNVKPVTVTVAGTVVYNQ
jgi:predicted ribosomally synthesized peptide with SipW-like signal peptide